jgi:hypothetical protein
MSLFLSYFSPRKPICNKKIATVDHAVDRFFSAVDYCFSYPPLSNHDYLSPLEIRSIWIKVLQGKNITPNFEAIQRGKREVRELRRTRRIIRNATYFSSRILVLISVY